MAGALHACPADPTEDDSAQTLVRMPLKMGYNAHSSGHREEGTIIAWSSVVLPQTLTQKMEIKLMGPGLAGRREEGSGWGTHVNLWWI